MSDSTTLILLTAVALTAGGIYMFDRNAKAATHSQPKFTQMNKPGDYFKPPSSTAAESSTSFKVQYVRDVLARVDLPSGKTFLD